MTLTEEKVIEQIREVFINKGQSPPALASSTVLDTSLGLESLDFAELATRLEGIFGHDPFAVEVPPISTVSDLAALYVAKSASP